MIRVSTCVVACILDIYSVYRDTYLKSRYTTYRQRIAHVSAYNQHMRYKCSAVNYQQQSYACIVNVSHTYQQRMQRVSAKVSC